MRLRIAQDVSALPTWGFSTRSTPWWGTIAFFAIEGTAFALAIGTYVYLYTINAEWPLGAPPPNPWPGTLMTVVQSGFPTEEMRDFFTTYAWVGAFDRITKFLEQGESA